METTSLVIYLGLTALTCNLIRILPMLLIRGKIQNQFIRSFLYYVPYVTLSVMTFPAILQVTDDYRAGLLAFVVGIVAARCNLNLFMVSSLCCLTVLLYIICF